MAGDDVIIEAKADAAAAGSAHAAAGCFSRLFFLWVNPLVRLSRKRVLGDDDMFEIWPSSEARLLTAEFDRHWDPQGCAPRELEDGRHLFWVNRRIFQGRFAAIQVLMFAQTLTSLTVPFLLKAFVDWFVDKSRPEWEGWLLGGIMVLLTFLVQQIFVSHATIGLYMVGMDVRSLVTSLVYRKATRLSQKARSQTTTGQVVSLMSSDSERLPLALRLLNNLWTAPIGIVFGLCALLWLIGWSGLVATFIMVAVLPLPKKVALYQAKVTRLQMVCTDTRVKTVNEGLQGIRVLKYNAWDTAFGNRVRSHRVQEVKHLRRLAWAQTCTMSLMQATPVLMAFGSMLSFALLDPDRFTPANVFTALSLLNIIRTSLLMLPMAIMGIVDLKSTHTRLQRYLLLEEQEASDKSSGPQVLGRVAIQGGSFQWEVGKPIELGKGKGKGSKGSKGKGGEGTAEEAAEEERAAFALRGVSVAAEAGQLCAIVGKVGSGKSSLLSALLREMPRRAGEVTVEGSVAYCAQVPWIQNATLRDNILFGSPMDEVRYDGVIKMCALGPDCESLPGGDLTEIGEKGVTLSGGQKARVALARACYRQASVYLLDDVLSAVDSETGSWLFQHCIKELLARKAVVVLATNAVHFLEQVGVVWVLKDGIVAEQGTFDELRARPGGDLNELLSLRATESVPQEKVREKSVVGEKGCVKQVGTISTRLSSNERLGELTAKELRAEGSLSWQVLLFYFLTCPGGALLPVAVLASAITGQASNNLFEWWLSNWTTSTADGDVSLESNLPVYVLLGFLAILFQLLRSLAVAELILRNCISLHELLLKGVMRAPMSFFDTTPLGRIMNRFSKDMGSMDTRLQASMPPFLMSGLSLVGVCLTIGINMPFFFLPLAPLIAFYCEVCRRFRPLNRDVQRIESASRSPLFAQFSETLAGTTTIRAYGEVQRFLDQSVERINASNRAFFTIHHANRWLQLRLESVGILVLLCVIGFALGGRAWGNVEPGVAALSMFYALNVSQILTFTVRLFVQTEADMTSAERIHEYAEKLAPEAAEVTEERPPPRWPSEGRIELHAVSMRYRPELPLVLKEVSLTIEGGWKVGVCGRTGSGKSTLLSVLFRIIDIYAPDNLCSGRIEIDGLDIGGLGLADLRRSLAIIPQDAVMFAGTVRENLDLFGEHGDAQLWEALRHASLAGAVEQLTGGLEARVAEGGENFSCGERQLICMARALLRQSRIICLDEATANIDVHTDATIQEVIKAEFADRTVLTIAHRLNTIAAHDRILVLDAGEVAEFGSPGELLAPGAAGKFRALVRELGDAAAAALEAEVLGPAPAVAAAPAEEEATLSI